MKITTTAALIFSFLFFLAAHGQAEEHLIYNDAQGRLVISNHLPMVGPISGYADSWLRAILFCSDSGESPILKILALPA